MLSFTKLYQLEAIIKPFIQELQCDKESMNGFTTATDNGSGDNNDIQLQIVGQEHDNLVLYTWNEHVSPVPASPPAQPPAQLPEPLIVTHFGVYDANTKTNKEIFCHDKKVQVVNCTISEEHTFIGFVTVEEMNITGLHGKIQRQNVYRAFLAEIQPRNRLFSLDLQRENHLQLQFLYGDYKSKSSAREAHLLVLLHRESIGLYHLPLTATRHGGVIMSDEPRKEQLFDKRFTWWQWQCRTSRLYVAHHRKQGRNDRGRSIYQCFLTCYQFNNMAVNEFKMEFPLAFDIPNARHSLRVKYFQHGPADIVPDSSINMRVLSHPNGSVCVCYQHSPNTESQSGRQSDSTVIHYSVLLIHHGRVLNSQCSRLPKHVAAAARLSFFWKDDYIVVQLPGYFTHMLNVGIDIEPSHHLLWHDATAYNGNNGDTAAREIADLVNFSMDSSTTGAVVYAPHSHMLYTVSVDHSTLVSMFTDTSDNSVRLAILHYAVVHARDLSLIKMLFGVLAANPTQPEVTDMLQEFLVGATFTAVQRHMSRLLLSACAFTLGQVFRGQVENDKQGNRLVNLTYSNLGQVKFDNLTSKQHSEDTRFWESVSCVHSKQGGNSSSSSGAPNRFNNANVRLAADSKAAEEAMAPPDVTDSAQATKSLLGRLSAAAKSAFSNLGSPKPLEEVVPNSAAVQGTRPQPSSTADGILGTVPEFLDRPHGGSTDSEQSHYIKQTVELLTNHMWRYQDTYSTKLKETKSKLRTVAEDYVRCQMHQSRLLCHLIWSILGSQQSGSGDHAGSHVSGSDHNLFHMLEKYYLATTHLSFPRPPGFQLYFTKLAFSCMDFRLFLQYADLGVLQVSLEFASQLLQDLDDSQKNVEVKLQVISRLPKECTVDLVDCLRRWHHPIAQRYLASHYASVCLSDDSSIGWEVYPRTRKSSGEAITMPDPQSQGPTAIGATYPPVAAFVRMLETYDPGLATADSIGGLEIDSKFIEQTSVLALNAQ